MGLGKGGICWFDINAAILLCQLGLDARSIHVKLVCMLADFILSLLTSLLDFLGF